MSLVTDEDVKEILDTDLDTTPFIAVADALVNAHLAGQNLTGELLKEIERWLAAHFACIRDPRFSYVQSAGEALSLERGKSGQGLSATSYGQQVLLMDTTGILAVVTTTKRASFSVD